MYSFQRGAAFAAVIAAVFSLAVPAAAQNARSSVLNGTNVAVIDIGTVFDHHQRFQGAIADIKKDIKALEGVMKQKRDQIQKLSEQAKELDPSSTDYQRLEGQAAQMMADLQVQQGLKRKEFMQREAKLYYQTYVEVAEQIADFANRYRIGLVVRYDSQEIKSGDRDSVIQGVNRAVVYQSKLDITRSIIDQLNRGTAPANLGSGPQIPRRR